MMGESKLPELLTCPVPWCRSTEIFDFSMVEACGFGHGFYCRKCGLKGPYDEEREGAAQRWNARHPDPRVAEPQEVDISTLDELSEENRILRAKMIFEKTMEVIEAGLGVRITLWPLGVGIGIAGGETITGHNLKSCYEFDIVGILDPIEFFNRCTDIAAIVAKWSQNDPIL